MAIKDYSTTAANNNANPPNGFPEQMAPSAVNDAARQLMADIRTHFNDQDWRDFGYTYTYASATSFTIAGADYTATYHQNRRICATGSATGTIYGTISSSTFSTNTTVNITWDSGSLQNEALSVSVGPEATNKPTDVGGVHNAAATVTTTRGDIIRRGASADERLALGTNGQVLTSDGTDVVWGSGVSLTGLVLPYAGDSTTAKPAGTLLCDGSAVSRTTYAALFAITGTTYGAGDGSSTFNLPDLRGRAIIAPDDMGGTAASVIGGTAGDGIGATLGSNNGSYESRSNYASTGNTNGFYNTVSNGNIQPSITLNYVIFY